MLGSPRIKHCTMIDKIAAGVLPFEAPADRVGFRDVSTVMVWDGLRHMDCWIPANRCRSTSRCGASIGLLPAALVHAEHGDADLTPARPELEREPRPGSPPRTHPARRSNDVRPADRGKGGGASQRGRLRAFTCAIATRLFKD